MRKIIILFFIVINSFYLTADENIGLINQDAVSLFEEPNIKSNIIKKLSMYEVVTIVSQDGSEINKGDYFDLWFKISISDGIEGWVNFVYIEELPIKVSKLFKEAFLYSDPNINSPVIETIEPNTFNIVIKKIIRKEMYNNLNMLNVNMFVWNIGELSGWINADEFLFVNQEDIRKKEVINNGLDFDFATKPDNIIEDLGVPVFYNEKYIPNRYNKDVEDILYELKYGGLSINIYYATKTQRYFDTYFSITSTKYNVIYGLNIGASKSYVLEILGKPYESESDQLKYIDVIENYPYSFVIFEFKDDIVSKIEWYNQFD
jgi:hypothetical protein